ncbi:hypothetical protein Cgig2_006434 [Carnegiea gigantea]|uniref:Uncharacterized protein n=1 Tax=Carnegiea gigantea TaxID=171969 RepID=A0A9Q1K9K6_9CARY|nr:hypothetical protein Cgig2_006434 [Carnegiea gigantea]
MTDTIMQQVTEKVRKAIEDASSARPLPTFNYMPTMHCESAHRHAFIGCPRRSDEVREMAYSERDGRSRDRNHDHSTGMRNALHELADKGQINHFLKRELCFLRKERDPARPELGEGECSTMIEATIAGGGEPTGNHLPPITLRRQGQGKKPRADVPTAYNIILGRPTLHLLKAFEADDGSIGKLQADQCTARECYLFSIRLLVERLADIDPQGLPLQIKSSGLHFPFLPKP